MHITGLISYNLKSFFSAMIKQRRSLHLFRFSYENDRIKHHDYATPEKRSLYSIKYHY